MLIGVHYVWAELDRGITRCEVDYSRADGHVSRYSLNVTGTVKCRSDDLRLSQQKRGLNGLEISFELRIAEPVKFENPASEQTRASEGGMPSTEVQQHLGWFTFHPANKSWEFGIDDAEQIIAEVNVTEGLFNEAWHWVRQGCNGSANVSLQVFGKQMARDNSFSSSYVWDCPEKQSIESCLYIASFGFIVKHHRAQSEEGYDAKFR